MDWYVLNDRVSPLCLLAMLLQINLHRSSGVLFMFQFWRLTTRIWKKVK
jgi:hypothetical protein